MEHLITICTHYYVRFEETVHGTMEQRDRLMQITVSINTLLIKNYCGMLHWTFLFYISFRFVLDEL